LFGEKKYCICSILYLFKYCICSTLYLFKYCICSILYWFNIFSPLRKSDLLPKTMKNSSPSYLIYVHAFIVYTIFSFKNTMPKLFSQNLYFISKLTYFLYFSYHWSPRSSQNRLQIFIDRNLGIFFYLFERYLALQVKHQNIEKQFILFYTIFYFITRARWKKLWYCKSWLYSYYTLQLRKWYVRQSNGSMESNYFMTLFDFVKNRSRLNFVHHVQHFKQLAPLIKLIN